MSENKERLILFLADELDPRERLEMEAELENDEALRRELEVLRAMLELADARAPGEPGEEYWSSFWSRLQPKLESTSVWQRFAEALTARRGVPLVAAAGAMATALIVAMVILYQLAVPQEPEPVIRTTTVTIKATEGFLEQAAITHLESSRLLLQELVNIPAINPDSLEMLAYTRQKGEHLLSQNRTFRIAAENKNAQRLAKLLDELELVLMDIANMDLEVAQEALNSLQRRIEKKKLLNKIAVMSTEEGSADRRRPGTEVM